jgi:predicted nucleotidyltransferase
MPADASFDEALEVLERHGVDFIVVGGIAAILQGSPLTTEDVDVVYLGVDENLRRLAAALIDLDATYVDPAGRTIRPDVGRLTAMRVHLLNTRYGRVDLMRTVGNELGYEQLIDRTLALEIGTMTVRVLELEAVIETKVQADRPKDRYQLPFLKQLLAEIQRHDEE